MSEQFSEKPARELAAAALTYKRPILADMPDIGAFKVTPDQVKAANAKRDLVLAQAKDRFKRKPDPTSSGPLGQARDGGTSPLIGRPRPTAAAAAPPSQPAPAPARR